MTHGTTGYCVRSAYVRPATRFRYSRYSRLDTFFICHSRVIITSRSGLGSP